MESPNFTLYFDGACLPNPRGRITVACAIYRDGEKIHQSAAIIGYGLSSDSVAAEYHALLTGLNLFVRLWMIPGASLEIRGDNLGVINRLKGIWKQKQPSLLHSLAAHNLDELRRLGVDVTLTWISREQNALCDALAKKFREEKVRHGDS